MKHCIFLLFFCFLFSTALLAQPPAGTKISGKVSVEKNNPARNATVFLLRQQDSATVKIAVPDDNGLFEFENIAPGNYIMNVTHTGYTNYYSDAFSLDEKHNKISVPSALARVSTSHLRFNVSRIKIYRTSE